jgi:hypothetical protein
VANGNDLDGQRHRVPGQVGAASIKSLMGEPRKRFTPQYANLQEVLKAALSRQQPASSYQHTDDDDADDSSPAETPREASLEDRLREVLGSGVVDDLERHGRTSLALSNWLHATGVKRCAAARTLAHMTAEHLDSMDLLDRITKEIEAIG